MSQTILETIVKITGDITGLQTALNSATDQTNQALGQVENTATQSTNKVGGMFSNLGGVMKGAVAGAAAAGVAALAGMAVAAGVSAVSMANDFDKALNRIQALTSSTAEEAKAYGEVVKAVFANGFGGSLEEAADAVALVAQQFKDLDPKSLQAITESAFDLQKAFDVDIQDSINSVNTMMKNFGVTAEEAFDLIAYGFQNGLNKSGDWLDTINEYSTQFREAGMSAGEFFAIVQSGAQAGNLGTDKIADLVKEFGLRIADGSKTTSAALKDLGLNAEEVAKKLGSGEWTKGQVFVEIQKRLANITDASVRQATAVALMGTQYEDMGGKAVAAVDAQVKKQKEMSDAMEKVRKQNQDLSSVMTSAGRQIQVALLPVGEVLIGLAKQAMPLVVDAAKTVASWITSMTASLKKVQTEGSPAIRAMAPIFHNFMTTVQTVVKAVVDVWNKVLVPVFVAIAPTLKAIFGVAIGYLNIFFGAIKGVFGAISKILQGDWAGAWNYFKAVILNAINNSNKIVGTFAKDFIVQLGAILTNIKIWAGNLGAQLAAAVVNGFNQAKAKAARAANDFVNGIKQGLGLPKGDIIQVPVAVNVVPKTTGYVPVPGFTKVGSTAMPAAPVNTASNTKVVIPTMSGNVPTPKPTPSVATSGITPTQAPAADDKDGKKKGATAPKWTKEDSISLQRMVRDLRDADKAGKVTTESLKAFNDKLEDMSRKATEAGVRNNAVVAGLITQGKALATTAAGHVKVKDAQEAANRAAKERKAMLSNLASAVKGLSDAELAQKIALEKGKDAARLDILNKEKQRRATENAKKAGEEYKKVLADINKLIGDWSSSAQGLTFGAEEAAIQRQYSKALSDAGENDAKRLEVAQEYEKKLLDLSVRRLRAQKEADLAALDATYNQAIADAKKVGADTTAITKAYNTQRAAVIANSDALISKAKIDSAVKLADQQAALDKATADKAKEQAKETLAVMQQLNADVFNALYAEQINSLDEMSNEQLAAFQATLDEEALGYAELGEEGATAIEVIGTVSNKVSEAIAANTKKAQEFFKTFSKDVQDTVSDIQDALGLGASDLDKFVSGKLAGADKGIAALQDGLEKAQANRVNLVDPEEIAAADLAIQNLSDTILNLFGARATKAKELSDEFWKTEADKAQQTFETLSKNNLELGNITQEQYNQSLLDSKAYWEDRLAQAEFGSEEYISVQNKLVGLQTEINKIQEDAAKEAEATAKKVEDAISKVREKAQTLKKVREDLSASEVSGKKEDASLQVTLLEDQLEGLLAVAKTEEEKAKITLEWSGKILEARKAEIEAEKQVSLAAIERARATALAQEGLTEADKKRINALYDGEVKRVNATAEVHVRAADRKVVADNKATKAILENNQKVIAAISKYGDMAKQAIGVIFNGLSALGAMSGEVASQWATDMGNMVDDLVTFGTQIAKGDWFGAAVTALTTIFNWFNRNKKAAEDAKKATDDFQKQFKVVSGDQFRSVEKYTTGFLFWQTDHYKETLDELGVSITKTLDSSIGSGLSSGIQNYLNGTGGIAEAINASLKTSIVDAITQAVIESAIIKEKLGPILEDLAYKIRNGLDVTSTLNNLKNAVPEVAASLESTLDPIKATLAELFNGTQDIARKLAEDIKAGVEGGFKSGIQKFLEGGTVDDMLAEVKQGFKSSIINAVLEAVMNGAIIKGSLGGLLTQLTEALAKGQNPSGIIASISAALPMIVNTLESTLQPIKDALKILDPVPTAPVAPAMPTGITGSNGVTGGVSTSNNVNNNLDLKFYITEASDADKIAREVERRIVKGIMGY